jgi:hypothetical protein
MASDEEATRFTPSHKIVCPFCRKNFWIGEEADGTPAATHDMPACEKFIEMPLEDYLAKVRRIYSP